MQHSSHLDQRMQLHVQPSRDEIDSKQVGARLVPHLRALFKDGGKGCICYESDDLKTGVDVGGLMDHALLLGELVALDRCGRFSRSTMHDGVRIAADTPDLSVLVTAAAVNLGWGTKGVWIEKTEKSLRVMLAHLRLKRDAWASVENPDNARQHPVALQELYDIMQKPVHIIDGNDWGGACGMIVFGSRCGNVFQQMTELISC